MTATLPVALRDERRHLLTWLRNDAFPLWWARGADHDSGGFHEALDPGGAPVITGRRARVQARQIFCYASAGALGWGGPWREAAETGMAFFIAGHRRPDGLFRTRLTPDGAPADDTAMAYDQAFALFALAAVSAISPDPGAFKAMALDVRRGMEGLAWRAGFREPAGPFPFQADPHMHLLEAALAWTRIDDHSAWPALADQMADMALAHFIHPQTGALGEYFDERWGPAPGIDGRQTFPGHQFEWAGLLLRWARARGRTDVDDAIMQLYAIGLRGVDQDQNVAVDALLDGRTIHSARARLWPQTERLKAALILAGDPVLGAGDDGERLLKDAVQASQGLRRYFETSVAGLWRDKLMSDGTFEAEPAPASSFYHIVSAILELERVFAADAKLP